MPGNSGRVRVILQPRDRKLIDALSVLRVVDREQAGLIMGFTSIRRTNARLLKLTRACLLRSSYIGSAGLGRRALYRLPKDRARTSPAFLEHQLILNRVYLSLASFRADQAGLLTWRVLARPVAEGFDLIPDAYAEVVSLGAVRGIFVEVDRGTESGLVWREKAWGYVSLAESGEFERNFGESRFRVAVLAPSSRRIEMIRRAVRAVTSKLFWFAPFEIIDRGSFADSSWLRPEGTSKVPLL